MIKQGIQIYARLKPCKAKAGLYEVTEDDKGFPRVSYILPKSEAAGYVNNKKEVYHFRFNNVLSTEASQQDVFDQVAKAVVDNVLEGYNGTIFAYGQTGSGKTFTITGGPARYEDRGLIPRSLSYIFQHKEENPDKVFTIHVSYLEIYNESGYDLLDPKHEASKLEDLPKVHLMEDAEGSIHLKNLSLQEVNNEETALNALFLGDTNRIIAETPMNMASTRSHCIFTIHVTAREPGSALIRKAKLHLVDLAGSERVKKTGVAGTLLQEAKYINLSLHHLEHVIVALSEKARSHIPYRNSMMTSVLRDSLGGNCMTTMVATCAVEKENMDESVSTCRFAQRVALIKNEAHLNEELDPKQMIARLKQQVKDLKDELAMATGEERTDDLTDEEKERCTSLVKTFAEDPSSEACLSVGGDMRKIQLCFHLLKSMILKAKVKTEEALPNSTRTTSPLESQSAQPGPDRTSYPPANVVRLQEILEQRDSEIQILSQIIKKERRRAARADVSAQAVHPNFNAEEGKPPASFSPINGQTAGNYTEPTPLYDRQSRMAAPSDPIKSKRKDLTAAQQEAFRVFRRDHSTVPIINQMKKDLKARCDEAKLVGADVSKTRTEVNRLKRKLEQLRVSLAVQGVSQGGDGTAWKDDPEEAHLRAALEEGKKKYKTLMEQLKTLKAEVDHLNHLLHKSQINMMNEFLEWWQQETETKGSERSGDSLHSSHELSPRLQPPLPHAKTSAFPNHLVLTAADRSEPSLIANFTNKPSLPAGRRTRADLPISRPPSSSLSSSSQMHSFDTHGSSFKSPRNVSVAIPQSGYGQEQQSRSGSIPSKVGSRPSRGSSRVDSTLESAMQSYLESSSAGHTVSKAATSAGGDLTFQRQTDSTLASRQIPLTGDRRTDADIKAFMEASQVVRQRLGLLT